MISMIAGALGGLLGGPIYNGQPSGCLCSSTSVARAQAELTLSLRNWAVGNRNQFMDFPSKTLLAGIFWERTGGKTHRVTIRRNPEVVFDMSVLANGSSSTIGMANAS